MRGKQVLQLSVQQDLTLKQTASVIWVYRLNNLMSFTNSTNHYFQAYQLLLKSFLNANANSDSTISLI